MKDLIISNFKMFKTNFETLEYISALNKLLPKQLPCKIGVCLPYTSLYLGENFDERIVLGAQNMNEDEFGNYTGEISVNMLKDFNVKFVLLGHSERRKLYGETNSRINKKIKTALRHGMKVVLCVGETRAQRNAKMTQSVLTKQIEEALVGIYENELSSIIVAYEPVWAVGTGIVAPITDIANASKLIRKIIAAHYSTPAAENQQIIYGGSLTSQTSKQIFKNKEICGALIGAASLDPKEFIKIITG